MEYVYERCGRWLISFIKELVAGRRRRRPTNFSLRSVRFGTSCQSGFCFVIAIIGRHRYLFGVFLGPVAVHRLMRVANKTRRL